MINRRNNKAEFWFYKFPLKQSIRYDRIDIEVGLG